MHAAVATVGIVCLLVSIAVVGGGTARTPFRAALANGGASTTTVGGSACTTATDIRAGGRYGSSNESKSHGEAHHLCSFELWQISYAFSFAFLSKEGIATELRV